MPAAPKVQLRLMVHSCVAGEFAAKAEVAGAERDVKVPGLIVELVSADGSMSQTVRVVPDKPEDAAEVFAVGEEVLVTYSIPPSA